MRQAAHAALQCDPTRGDAEFYATIHTIMGAYQEASIAAAYRWLDFAPKSALAHFWVGSTVAATGRDGRRSCVSAEGRPASTVRNLL